MENDDEHEDVYKGLYIFLQRSVRMHQLYTYIHTQRGEWREKEAKKYTPLYPFCNIRTRVSPVLWESLCVPSWPYASLLVPLLNNFVFVVSWLVCGSMFPYGFSV